MTRASDWRSPSRDLITKVSFAEQPFLVTNRAPRLLMFSVKVNSLLDALVIITATAVALLVSCRPGGIANRTVKPPISDGLAARPFNDASAHVSHLYPFSHA